MFEAGALSKSVVKAARIHPFLVGVEEGDLTGPLAQFQATRYSKDDMRKLIHALNSEAADAALSPMRVDKVFDVCWSDLERRIRPLHDESCRDLIGEPPAPSKTEPISNRVLTEDEIKILRAVANSSDGLRRDEAAELVGLHPQHTEHLMENLEDLDFLDPAYNAAYGTSWELSKKGRAFMVREKFL